MDFDFSAAEDAFLSEVEHFLAENQTPAVMDADGEMFSHVADTPPKRAFNRKLAERGWFGVTWPRDLGGAGRSGARNRPPRAAECPRPPTSTVGVRVMVRKVWGIIG